MKKQETKQTVLLKHHLQQLKLPSFERDCEEFSFRCAAENIDHLGYLLQLASRELQDREARAAERRLKSARFPSLKTLETFDFQAQPSLNQRLVTELMRGEYIENRATIFLIGQPGTGKTHLATAFGIKACQQGKKVRFFRSSDLISQMLEAREDKQLLRLKKSLSLLDVLILDELGYIPASKAGSELFFDIISQAYERTSVIITTNLPFDQWTEVLGSQRLTGAVLDRLTHRCHILEASGESFRLRAAKKRIRPQKEN
jgi:DNA replication protein DnaC